jgi:hypothetical protein
MNPRLAELAWYRANGKHPERIIKDTHGNEYVIGDWGWHRKHPDLPEFIEDRMRHEGVYEGKR